MKEFGVLFDLDGTLVNSLADICGNINRVREKRGLTPRPFGELTRFIGKGAEYLVAGSFPELPGSAVPELVEAYRDEYLANPFLGGSVYPGVRVTLEALRGRGARLAVCTNKLSAVSEMTLDYYLPGFRFEAVYGPDRVSRKKPEPEHLLEPMRALGLSAGSTWFVGDDPVDAACAEAAGVGFFAAGYGFGGVKAAPESTLSAFTDLLAKLPA